MYKYYKVYGCGIKYSTYTDALEKAITCYAHGAINKVETCYESTTNKQTAEKYTIVKEV